MNEETVQQTSLSPNAASIERVTKAPEPQPENGQSIPASKLDPAAKPKEMDFFVALKELAGGARITKIEWDDKAFYGVLREGKVVLHRPDGKYYDWIMSDGDLAGTDWLIL